MKRPSLPELLFLLLSPCAALAADHNDPNAINSIFSDIDVSAADLYDMFGYPSDDTSGGEKVVIALTFAAVPKAGTLDPDMLYRVLVYPAPRVAPPVKEEDGLDAMLKYYDAIKEKYLHAKPAEVRTTVDKDGKAHLSFVGFPSGSFTATIDTNKPADVATPEGQTIKVFVGGRDDAFFNDLPGFFRSINYAPQFYHVPHTRTDLRELKIPKTLIELDGNTLFNFNPDKPMLGQTQKEDLPAGPLTWSGNKFYKDAKGNYRFVYSGKDARAGGNVNAVILEVPLTYITKTPAADRIVNVWGESWVAKASRRIAEIPDDRRSFFARVWDTIKAPFSPAPSQFDHELGNYKRVDTDGQPFSDAALSEREDDRQVGANNIWLGPHFVVRLAHLGWGFGPSISALGLPCSFDHDNSPVSVWKTYDSAAAAFPRIKKTLFQPLNMPDDSWNKKHLNIPLRRPFEIFVPNVSAIDMDTTGTWPFGRRLEDQVATRFLAMFLDMSGTLNGKKITLETLNDQALWDAAPIEPKVPPNPLKNDKPFLDHFPYLADPW